MTSSIYAMKTIFLVNSLDLLAPETIADIFGPLPVDVGFQRLGQTTIAEFEEFVSILEQKGIVYDQLKDALIPRPDRKEIVLVFDTLAIRENLYGAKIFEAVIPSLDRDLTCSILVGDYVDMSDQPDLLYKMFMNDIVLSRDFQYKNGSQFFLVYVNNLSDQMVQKMVESLQNYEPFVGIFDLTFPSRLKEYLSAILSGCCVKCNDLIIQGHEDDINDEQDQNTCGYPFGDYGYKLKSIREMYYDSFLRYEPGSFI